MTERPLNKRQMAFVAAFVAGRPAWIAARDAGYSGTDKALRATGSRLLTYDGVRREVMAAYAAIGLDPAAIIGKLSTLAFGDVPAQVQLRALEIMARHTLTTKQEVQTGEIVLDQRTVDLDEHGNIVERAREDEALEAN